MPRESRLTADIPLGPFEGTVVKVYAAQGAKAKLHASERCPSLSSAAVAAREVVLDKRAVESMCSRCAEYGPWGGRATGLGIFLAALQGAGLLYQLDSYTGGAEEPWDAHEVENAVPVLKNGRELAEDDDDAWEAVSAVRHLVEGIVDEWRCAAKSMTEATRTISAYPWLRTWAQIRLEAKAAYLEQIRAAAVRQLSARDVLISATIANADIPEFPTDAPELSGFGDASAIRAAMRKLWRRWSGAAEDRYTGHSGAGYLVYESIEGVSRRKNVLEKLTALVEDWGGAAGHEADEAGKQDHRIVTITVCEESRDDRSADEHRISFGQLTDWETAVVLIYQQSVNWDARAFRLSAPPLIADRLLRDQRDAFRCEVGEVEHEAERTAEVLGPGAFDDSTIAQRRPATPSDLRMYSLAGAQEDDPHLVFSPERGVEVITLRDLRRRSQAGWAGVVIAAADNLPASLIEPWMERVKTRAAALEPGAYPHESANPETPDFAARLGTLDGEVWLVRLARSDGHAERSLRALALVRSVTDYRTLAAGVDINDRPGILNRDLWMALLSPVTPNLRPFYPESEDRFEGGSGIPLGPLSCVQVYASNLSGYFMGKAHSVYCAHSSGAVRDDDDMVTLAEYVAHYDNGDHCSKCGGYAVRRLTESQLEYYRCAHRADSIIRRWARRTDIERDRARAKEDAERLTELRSIVGRLPDVNQEAHSKWSAHLKQIQRRLA